MIRLLGQSEFGLYSLSVSVVSYLSLMNFGLSSAYIKYFSKYKVEDEQENIARLNGMYIIVYSVIGVLVLFAGSFLVLNTEFILGNKLSPYELNKAKILLSILVINMAISIPASLFQSHITANERYIFQKSISMIRTIVNPLVMLPILLMGYRSVGMVIVTTILNISVETSNIIFCIKKLKMRFLYKYFDISLLKEMIIFSSYIFMNMIIDRINWSIGTFLLARFHGTVQVAIYGIAAQLNTYYMILSTAISNVFIPRVNRIVAKFKDDQELTNLFTRIGRIQFALLCLIFSILLFFGKQFITLWAGSNYEDSYLIALILIFPVSIPLIQNLGIEIQKAKNKHQFRSLLYLLIAIANVMLTIPLAKRYGGAGAAMGTALSLFIGNGIIMNFYYHKKIGINIKYFWAEIFKFSKSLFVPFISGYFIQYYFNLYDIFKLPVAIALYISIFTLSIWFFGFNEYEKNLFGSPIIRLLKKLKRR